MATSPTRRVGDGPEYLAMALQLAAFRRPSMSEVEIERARAEFKRSGAGFEIYNGTIDLGELRGRDGRFDCPHFWLYSALAVPGVWLAKALGAHPNLGFTLANAALFLLGLWVVSARLDWAATLLVFAGPILWWIDKAHTEAFTFSLLAIGVTLLETPWWSMLAFAVASAQNLPLAAGIPLAGLTGVVLRPGLWRDERLWTGALAAGAVAALHPLYFLARLGVVEPQTIMGGTQLHLPRLIEMGSFVWDPNVGILPNFPALAVALLGALVVLGTRDRRALLHPSVVLAAGLAGFLLLCFAQTSNFNSGATPGPARYGLWLVPLAIPLLDRASGPGARGWRAGLAVVAVASCVGTVATYRPALPESYLQPTRLAAFLWERYPSLDNPLPEIFAERLTGRENFSFTAVMSPIATRSCSKVLLVGGAWPATCAPGPGPAPAACTVPTGYCYANRGGGGYRYSVR